MIDFDSMNKDVLAFMMAHQKMKCGELREIHIQPFLAAKYGEAQAEAYRDAMTKRDREEGQEDG